MRSTVPRLPGLREDRPYVIGSPAGQVCWGATRRVGSWVWLVPCEILVKKLGRHEEVAGCRHGSQWPSRHPQHG